MPKPGRPKRLDPAPVGCCKLYRHTLDMLVDLTRWRKSRLEKTGYSVADTVVELLGERIRAEWEAELKLRK